MSADNIGKKDMGMNTSMPRTPFPPANGSVSMTLPYGDMACSIFGKLQATVKQTTLTPGHLKALLDKLPKDAHIINISVQQFEHHDCKPGEMYNSVDIEYQSVDEMKDIGVTYRSPTEEPSILLCGHKSINPEKAASKEIPVMGDFEEMVIRAALPDETSFNLYRFVGIGSNITSELVFPIKSTNDIKKANFIIDIENFMFCDKDLCLTMFQEDNMSIGHGDDINKDPWPDIIIRKFRQLRAIAVQHGYHIKEHLDDEKDIDLSYTPRYKGHILITRMLKQER